MATIYLAMQIGVLGVVDWHEMLNQNSPAYTSVVSLVLERSWGATAAKIVTVFILITAFTSVFAGLLAGIAGAVRRRPRRRLLQVLRTTAPAP